MRLHNEAALAVVASRHRQRKPEPASLPCLALDAHVAAARADDLARQVEAEADPFPLGARNAEELLEDAVTVFGRNAFAAILHLEPDGVALGPGPDGDLGPGGAVPERIADQVVEH